jgi:hypothetical protein
VGCGAVYGRNLLTFWRNVLPSPSGEVFIIITVMRTTNRTSHSVNLKNFVAEARFAHYCSHNTEGLKLMAADFHIQNKIVAMYLMENSECSMKKSALCIIFETFAGIHFVT